MVYERSTLDATSHVTTFAQALRHASLRRPIENLSYLEVPPQAMRRLQVGSGPGRGLLFELNPSWGDPNLGWQVRARCPTGSLRKIETWQCLLRCGPQYRLSLRPSRGACGSAQVFAFEPDVQDTESEERHVRLSSLGAKIEGIHAAVISTSEYVALELPDSARRNGNAHVARTPNDPYPRSPAPRSTISRENTTRRTLSRLK
jgi:hypothetical protein